MCTLCKSEWMTCHRDVAPCGWARIPAGKYVPNKTIHMTTCDVDVSAHWTTISHSDSVSIAGVGRPVFGGTRWRWRADRVDLSPVAGASSVRLRWRSLSDAGTNFDGMNFDTLRVCVYDPAMQPAPAAVGDGPAPARLVFAPPAPNPARGAVTLSFATPEAGPITLEIIGLRTY